MSAVPPELSLKQLEWNLNTIQIDVMDNRAGSHLYTKWRSKLLYYCPPNKTPSSGCFPCFKPDEKQIILKTQRSFSKYLDQFNKDMEDLKKYMDDEDSDFSKVIGERFTRMLQFYEATKIFVENYGFLNANEKFNNINFSNHKDDRFSSKIPGIFQTFSQLESVIKNEAQIRERIPYRAIRYLFLDNKTTRKEDIKELKNWVRKLNQSNITIELVHKQLVDLAIYFKTKEENSAALLQNVARVEFYMEEQGFPITENDEKMSVDEKALLRFNYVANYKEVEIKLAEIPSPKKRVVYFKDHANPKLAILKGLNPASIGIEHAKAIENSRVSIIPVIPIKEYNFAEHWASKDIDQTLDSLAWKSFGEKIAAEDNPVCQSLTSMLDKLIRNQETPSSLTLSSLTRLPSGEICFILPVEQQKFDFMALEQFVYDVSLGNLAIYTHIMKQSGMDDHYIAGYFKEVIKNAFLQNTELRPHVYRIDDPTVVFQASKLHKAVRNLMEECTFHLSYMNQWDSGIKDELIKKIDKLFLKHGITGRLRHIDQLEGEKPTGKELSEKERINRILKWVESLKKTKN